MDTIQLDFFKKPAEQPAVKTEQRKETATYETPKKKSKARQDDHTDNEVVEAEKARQKLNGDKMP